MDKTKEVLLTYANVAWGKKTESETPEEMAFFHGLYQVLHEMVKEAGLDENYTDDLYDLQHDNRYFGHSEETKLGEIWDETSEKVDIYKQAYPSRWELFKNYHASHDEKKEAI